MTVIIRRKKTIAGTEINIPVYEPSGEYLTKERREKANCLDMELKKFADQINANFDIFQKTKNHTEFDKWRWLGNRLKEVLNKCKYLDTQDIDNNRIWPAIGQYLRTELKRGYDTKRSGTPKDHFRKCWLLATLPNIEWIKSWSAWDSFTDRGEQIVASKKILPMLGRKISKTKMRLKSKDFQKIARLIINNLPEGSSKIADIDSMTDKTIENIIENALKDFTKMKDRNH